MIKYSVTFSAEQVNCKKGVTSISVINSLVYRTYRTLRSNPGHCKFRFNNTWTGSSKNLWHPIIGLRISPSAQYSSIGKISSESQLKEILILFKHLSLKARTYCTQRLKYSQPWIRSYKNKRKTEQNKQGL